MPAASTVSSRATASNEAGTVSRMSWFSSRSSAFFPRSGVPGVAKVLEVGGGAATGEIFATPSVAVHGRDRPAAIDAGVRKPALGRTHQPARAPWPHVLGRTFPPRDLEGSPWKSRAPGGNSLGGRQVEKGRQEALAGGPSPNTDDLRNRQGFERVDCRSSEADSMVASIGESEYWSSPRRLTVNAPGHVSIEVAGASQLRDWCE